MKISKYYSAIESTLLITTETKIINVVKTEKLFYKGISQKTRG